MTTFLMIRHGESEANRGRVFAGHMDAALQDRGLEQAKRTAEYIVRTYCVDAVYASDLRRAYDTGKCVAELLGLPVIADRDLREIDAGEWEGVKFDELVKRFPEDYGVWLHDIGHARCTGGESVAHLGERVRGALLRMAAENDGKTVVVATHATPIRVMQCLVQARELARMKDIPWVSNASVSVLTYDQKTGEWAFSLVSEDAHLGDMRTTFAKNV